MNWKKIKPFLFSILIAVGVGALSGFLTKDAMPAYESLPKSNLTPPSIVFPIVWTILFVLMGISAAIIFRSDSPDRKKCLWLYGIQLAVNFLWSIFFFNLQWFLFSFLWLFLLWLLILATIWNFWEISQTAALLLFPYLIWVSFAGYLNFVIWILNR